MSDVTEECVKKKKVKCDEKTLTRTILMMRFFS